MRNDGLTMDQGSFDFMIYGMPVYNLDSTIYGGLFGNAVRAVGLANNLAIKGYNVALVVDKDFKYDDSPRLSKNLYFLKKHDGWEKKTQYAEILIVTCTNLQSFKDLFGQNPSISHPRKFYVCCFDNHQNIDLNAILNGAIGITFNNKQQKYIWDKRNTGLPSFEMEVFVGKI
jgi:hypothetical protein